METGISHLAPPTSLPTVRASKSMADLGKLQGNNKNEMDDDDGLIKRGVSRLWAKVNHIALVVRDIGRSLHFYTDIIGMQQVLRPDFDRHGAWLTFGNVDLHLIKGAPAVHPDDDLIVSHIALTVTDMPGLRAKLQALGVQSRKNVSVPNPKLNTAVDQAFVRDPDGYYIEFCNCDSLENYLHDLMEAQKQETWDLNRAQALAKASKTLRRMAEGSRSTVAKRWMLTAEAKKENVVRKDSNGEGSDNNMSDDGEERQDLSRDVETLNMEEDAKVEVDQLKLGNLLKRRKVYGDITQTATPEHLEELLIRYHNNVPRVIDHLKQEVHRLGYQKHIPPAFYERNGELYQPPSIQMEITMAGWSEENGDSHGQRRAR